MYCTGRPLMPPLSLTQSKYAFATLPIVVKSTPGMSIPIPPILIGRPVAFFPVPRPQTDFVADAFPEPTGAVAVSAPVAQPVTISARTQLAARTPMIVFVDLMDPSSWVSRASFDRTSRPISAAPRLRVSSRAPSSPRRASRVRGDGRDPASDPRGDGDQASQGARDSVARALGRPLGATVSLSHVPDTRLVS